jgi:hypothetical protein
LLFFSVALVVVVLLLVIVVSPLLVLSVSLASDDKMRPRPSFSHRDIPPVPDL